MSSLKRRREPPDEEDWEIVRAAKKSRFIIPTKDVVKIIVGPEDGTSHNFYFHHNQLTTYSEIFKAALGTEDDAAHFEIFSTFIYTGRIDIFAHDHAPAEPSSLHFIVKEDATEFNLLTQLWIFGDKLTSQPFKDAVMDPFTAMLSTPMSFPHDLHKLVYPSTCGPNALRRLAVDIALASWSDVDLTTAEMDHSWCEFFRDVALRARAPSGSYSGVLRHPNCYYHDHGDDGQCYNQMRWASLNPNVD